VQTYRNLIASLPPESQHLFFYILDLLSVFDRNSSVNLMTASNLAVIFQPGILRHPPFPRIPDTANEQARRAQIDLDSQEHKQSQEVLEFLIEHQEDFVHNSVSATSTTTTVASTSGVVDKAAKEKTSRGSKKHVPATTSKPTTDAGDGEDADDEDWQVVPAKKDELLSRRGSESEHERRRLRRKSHDQRRVASDSSSQIDPAAGSKVRRSRTLPSKGSNTRELCAF
jgi:hypothetical protein